MRVDDDVLEQLRGPGKSWQTVSEWKRKFKGKYPNASVAIYKGNGAWNAHCKAKAFMHSLVRACLRKGRWLPVIAAVP